MKNSLCLLGLALCFAFHLFAMSAFTDRIWIEKNIYGTDERLHITINTKEDIEKVRAAFPHGFTMSSFNPIDLQIVNIACSDMACDFVYEDAKRDYRQELDSGIRRFDLNPEMAIQLYQTFNVEPKIHKMDEVFAVKSLAIGHHASIHCVQSQTNPRRWPACYLTYQPPSRHLKGGQKIRSLVHIRQSKI